MYAVTSANQDSPSDATSVRHRVCCWDVWKRHREGGRKWELVQETLPKERRMGGERATNMRGDGLNGPKHAEVG